MKKLLLFLIFICVFLYANGQGTAPRSWELTGNSNTSTRNFLGTTDTVPLIFKTSGMERMRLIDNGAFLGIGTANPFASLHLHYYYGGFAPSDPNRKIIQLTTNGTGSNYNNGFCIFSNETTKDILFKQQEQAKLFIEGPGGGLMIDPNGNIGVGNLPTAKLDVNGSFKAQNANITGTLTTNNFSINGNFGLGTNTPSEKLHLPSVELFSKLLVRVLRDISSHQ